MKKTFAGITVLVAVIVSMLIIFHLAPNFRAAKKTIPQTPPPSLLNEKTPVEQIIAIAEEPAVPTSGTTHKAELSSLSARTKLMPLRYKIIIGALTEEDTLPQIAGEQVGIKTTDLVTYGEQKPPSPPQMIMISRSIDMQPALASKIDNKPPQGLGLLTDTDETEENQIIELQSRQVQPNASRKAGKKQKNIGQVR